MLRGERRFPLRPRKGRPPFYVLTLSRRPPFPTRAQKSRPRHAKYSKNKKTSRLLISYYRFRTTVAIWWTRQESATHPYLRYKKIRTSTPTCVKLRVIFARQTYIYIIYLYYAFCGRVRI